MTDQQDLRARLLSEADAWDAWDDTHASVRCVSTPALLREAAAQLGRAGDVDYVPGALDASSPPRVWLQIDTDGDNDIRDERWPGSEHVTWHDEPIGGLEIQYVRADLVSPQLPAGVPDGFYLKILVAAGHITQEVADQTRDIAQSVLAAAPQPDNKESR